MKIGDKVRKTKAFLRGFGLYFNDGTHGVGTVVGLGSLAGKTTLTVRWGQHEETILAANVQKV